VLLTELAIPVLILLCVAALRTAIHPKEQPITIPSTAALGVSNWDGLYQYPPTCNSENLIWRCDNNYPCTQATSVDEPTGCQLKKIAVAPSTSSNTAGASAAQEFITFQNSQSTYAKDLGTFVYFDSESAFLSYMSHSQYSVDSSIDIYSTLVVFSGGYPNWEYTVRTNQTYNNGNPVPDTSGPIIDISLKYGDQYPSDGGAPYLQAYAQMGYTSLTDAIGTFIATQTCINVGNCSTGDVVQMTCQAVANFPSKKANINGFWGQIGFLFALLMIMTLLYPISNVIRALVQEKETKIREGMAMMSMSYGALWLSWLFNFLCLFLPLSILLTIVGQTLFVYSEGIYIFFYFFVFFNSAVSYAILISVLINRTFTAAIVGCLVFFGGFFVYVGMSAAGSMKRSQIMAGALHPAAAFTFGTLAFIEYEDGQIGITSNTWNQSNEYAVTFQDMLNMMFIDAIWMGFLSWYLLKVWPSEYGTHEPWYFLFMPSYWISCATACMCCFSAAGHGVSDVSYERVKTDPDGPVPVEDIADALKAQVANKTCIDIVGITKQFDTATGTKTAVDNLHLQFFSGQITSLLGHNGAGKTTLISMLTGLTPPTSGTAFVEGRDLRYEMHEIRENLGVCPQHDILFPDLTVEEHLSLFASFKGTPRAELEAEITKMIEAVGLTEKRKVYARQLSGGQKRKLSVGIAFIGGSRVVVLDEPTSGMDPYSRRFTWNLIRQYKEGRIIVLTTHFMDEADLLGDRIAIMGDGKLCCCGSSLFLKKSYGVGYNLVIEKASVVGSSTQPIKEAIEAHVPDANMLTDVGTEITFQLPLSASDKFPKLFEQVDDHMTELGVRSYGMSVTTLEEVFIKIAHGTNTNATADAGRKIAMEQKRKRSISHHGSDPAIVELVPATAPNKDVEAGVEMANLGNDAISNGKSLAAEREFTMISTDDTITMFFKHIHACVLKRYLYFKRDIKSFIFLYLIPVLFVLIGALICALVKSDASPRNLDVSGHLYNPSISNEYLPMPYSSGSTFCYPGLGCNNFQGTPSTYMSAVSGGSNFPLIPLADVTSIFNMSTYLYDNMDTRAASTIGAISYANMFSSGNNFTIGYILHGNFTALHASPVYQNWVLNGLVAAYSPAVTVTTNVHPLPLTNFQKSLDTAANTDLIGTFILLSIPFVATSFATFIVREREVKAKHQQLVSGVSIVSFWLSCWIWDFVSVAF
jgi:ATP-binding cassette subfamily A (ABC1) protein 3